MVSLSEVKVQRSLLINASARGGSKVSAVISVAPRTRATSSDMVLPAT